MVWSDRERHHCRTLVLRLYHAIYVLLLLVQTYICAAKLATWGVGPDVKKGKQKEKKERGGKKTEKNQPGVLVKNK